MKAEGTIEIDQKDMAINHAIKAALFLVKVLGVFWLAEWFGIIEAIAR